VLPSAATRRTVLSNTKGKTKLRNDFQAFCAIDRAIDVEETERRIIYNLLQKLQVKAGNVDKEDKLYKRDLYSCKSWQDKASP
jgi:ribosomal protein S10